MLAGAETFVDIARFGEKKLELLRRFRPFRDGTPAHDHLGDIFATLDIEPALLGRALTGAPAEVIAIDGKTSRCSYQKTGAKAAIHMVPAFAARQRLVLGQVNVADKSNEIVAIPKLLEMLAIEGAIVTIDAMGCQRDITWKVLDKKADYVLALKGNQGALRVDVELFVAEQKANEFKVHPFSQQHQPRPRPNGSCTCRRQLRDAQASQGPRMARRYRCLPTLPPRWWYTSPGAMSPSPLLCRALSGRPTTSSRSSRF